MSDENLVRRPIAARETRWAATAAAGLARSGVSPNQISVASAVCAALAGACLAASGGATSTAARMLLPIAAAAFVQLRLLCNLFDGMVAVEGGKKTKSGEVYNDFPDRIADAFVLVGAGHAAPFFPGAVELGWAAALLAVTTAYVRTLGGSFGLRQDFVGPMAKQHRMAVVTGASLLAAVEGAAGLSPRIVPIALGVIAVGCAVTIVRRLGRIVAGLEAR